MHKGFLGIAAGLAAFAVGIGAFGAHALKTHFTVDALTIFETGVRYQFYHCFALLAAGILWRELSGESLRWSGRLFIIGIFFFCGSLYCLAFIISSGIKDYNWVGALTPIGGLSFILGWMLMLRAALIKKIGSNKFGNSSPNR